MIYTSETVMPSNTKIVPIRELNPVNYFDITFFLKNKINVKDVYNNFSYDKRSPYYNFKKSPLNNSNSFAIVLPAADDEPNINVNWAMFFADNFISARHFQFRIWKQSLKEVQKLFFSAPIQYKKSLISNITLEYNNRFIFKNRDNMGEMFAKCDIIPQKILSGETLLNYEFSFVENSHLLADSYYFISLKMGESKKAGEGVIDISTQICSFECDGIDLLQRLSSENFEPLVNDMNSILNNLLFNLLTPEAKSGILVFS